MGTSLAVSEHAHPVILFCEVDQVEITGKGPGHVLRFAQRHLVYQPGQVGVHGRIGVTAPRLAQRPNPLLQVIDFDSRLLPDNPSQCVA